MNPLLGPVFVSSARRTVNSAQPGAPVVPEQPKPRPVRSAMATALRRTADRLEPQRRPAPRPVTNHS
jgi:hypothetical protein